MIKKVYICFPWKDGDNEGNLENLKKCIRYALNCGTSPVVPQFYDLCIDTDKTEDSEASLSAGLNLLWFCDEMWIFGSEITKRMKIEIKFCENLNIKVLRISIDKIEKG